MAEVTRTTGIELSNLKAPIAMGLIKKAQGKCWWNGNYVTRWFHSFTDPLRYLKGQTKATKLLLHVALRPLFRAPFPITFGGAGAAAGASEIVLGHEQ